MAEQRQHPIVRIDKDRLCAVSRPLVEELPLKLIVNGCELATLVASPHQLNFLVAGFFLVQGLIDSLDDLLMLGICAEQGVAEVRIRGEVPEGLRPVLTSGCGTGIAFDLAAPEIDRSGTREYSPQAIFSLMEELARRTQLYQLHGGIHSAAVGDGDRLVLHAEDLGRHSTLDRLAGEALFRGIDLKGTLLVTSGRISTEMVAKAARLGMAVIASRTSPTATAVAAAEQAGVTLIGYVRNRTLEVFTHAERISLNPGTGKIPGVAGAILAGGESRRMGCDKSLLPYAGARFIDHIYRRLSSLFEEVVIVTNSPELYAELPCRKVPDLLAARGPLTGIHSALQHTRRQKVFVVACDMPLLSTAVVRRLCLHKDAADIVVPKNGEGLEPLHALYDRRCGEAIPALVAGGNRKIVDLFPVFKVLEVPGRSFGNGLGDARSFHNINTPTEYFSLRGNKPVQEGLQPSVGTELRTGDP